MTTPAHPGNDYYVFTETGTIQAQSDPALVLGLKAAGWAGPYSWTQAQNVLKQGQTVSQAAKGAASDATSDVSAVVGFLGKLGDSALWIRIAEVVLGLALVIVGLDKALAGSPGGSAAHAVAKGAMLALWLRVQRRRLLE